MGIALAHFVGAAKAFNYHVDVSDAKSMKILPQMDAVATIVLSR